MAATKDFCFRDSIRKADRREDGKKKTIKRDKARKTLKRKLKTETEKRKLKSKTEADTKDGSFLNLMSWQMVSTLPILTLTAVCSM